MSRADREHAPQGGRLSFRKRRPRLFIALAVLAVLLLLWLLSAFMRYADRAGLFSGPRLAVLRVEGPIADAEAVVEWAAMLRRDTTVAGVLLRIDSPGGAVAPSQEMYAAVKRLAAVKPVIVSMGTAAASGGYYIAVAGREIYANPSSLTGSIGVRMQLANVEGLMERIGVRSESFATGPLKNTGSPFQTLSPEERAYLDALIRDMLDEFVATVAEHRGLSPETVRMLADGRAYTGRQALEAGLVDHLGDAEDALNRLAALTGVNPEAPLLEAPKPSKPWWRELIGVLLDLEEKNGMTVPMYRFYY